MTRKEFIQLLRDPRMKFFIFFAPVIQLLIFGYAATNDVRRVPTAIYDQDNSAASRELLSRFANSGTFALVEHVSNEADARSLLDRGRVQALIRVNRGFEGDLRAAKTAILQMIVDGTDSNTARILLDDCAKIAANYSRGIVLARLSRLKGSPPEPGEVELESRAWFNENLESRNFYVPAVIAMIVTLVTLVLTSMAVVREKEIGTIEQIMVAPITPLEFILGKTIPSAAVGFADVILVTAAGVLWFEVPIRGSLFLLFFATALYLMTTLGVGLFISTISRTQQQAMMTTFLFALPAILLSGFFFPIANMPEIVQWLTYGNPLVYFLIIVRSVFLKGIGAEVLWPQVTALAVMGPLTLLLASRRFRKTLA